jgi:uncharacterized protein
VILFCDTSALMKLFVQESHSESVDAAAQAAGVVAVSQLAWVEMCAGLALKQRTGQLGASVAAHALTELALKWSLFSRAPVDATLVERAGQFASRFGLRAYDSVQLATVARLCAQEGDLVSFCCFDKALNTAARELGIRLALM